MTLRNLAPVAPFVARWDWPLFRRADGLDPARLKQAGGRPPMHTPETILELLGNERLTSTAWRRLAQEECGLSKSRFFELLKQLENDGKIVKSRIDKKWEQVRKWSGNWYDDKSA